MTMPKRYLTTGLLLAGLLPILAGCSAEPKLAAATPELPLTPGEYYLAGEHELLELDPGQSSELRSLSELGDTTAVPVHDGPWFVVTTSGKHGLADARLACYWRMNNGAYGLAILKWERIRLKIDETAASPSLAFAFEADRARYFRDMDLRTYRPNGFDNLTPQELIDRFAHYPILTIRPTDLAILNLKPPGK
ncbi:MAG: hypothetical protein HY975_02510 [Candidatus Kerfeldbacteria bacterium]|nr:hypothetical protein [Candidatus Kerfeldbacteria bacterium]